MGLKELIERAEKEAGSQKALGLILGINPSNLRNAKAGQQGLPNYACMLIADMLGVDDAVVIAASELVTEKKQERRDFWEKKIETLATVLFILALLPYASKESIEFIGFFGTTLANDKNRNFILCQIMSYCLWHSVCPSGGTT